MKLVRVCPFFRERGKDDPYNTERIMKKKFPLLKRLREVQ